MISKFIDSMTKLLTGGMRPWLTMLITVNYNAVLLWAVLTGHMSLQEYITNVGPVNTLILGFWFGEHSAMVGVQAGVDSQPTPPTTTLTASIPVEPTPDEGDLPPATPPVTKVALKQATPAKRKT